MRARFKSDVRHLRAHIKRHRLSHSGYELYEKLKRREVEEAEKVLAFLINSVPLSHL
jgi:hypothetical protein